MCPLIVDIIRLGDFSGLITPQKKRAPVAATSTIEHEIEEVLLSVKKQTQAFEQTSAGYKKLIGELMARLKELKSTQQVSVPAERSASQAQDGEVNRCVASSTFPLFFLFFSSSFFRFVFFPQKDCARRVRN